MKSPTKSNKIVLNKNNSLKQDKIIEGSPNISSADENDYEEGFKAGEKSQKQKFIEKIEKCKIHTAGALILIEKKEILKVLGEKE